MGSTILVLYHALFDNFIVASFYCIESKKLHCDRNSDLPMGQWDRQAFFGLFLILLADRLVLLKKPATQGPPLMF
jgi:hypothetical protein